MTNKNTKPKKIGRPINCFMAFRLEKHQEISSQTPGLNHRDISKIIAKWWKEASEAEKAPYRAIASKAKAEHAKRYPDYKYQPVKKSERQVRPYHRREDAATRQRKAQAKEELMKQWMGPEEEPISDDASSFCDSPFTQHDGQPCLTPCVSSTEYLCQPMFDDMMAEEIKPIYYPLPPSSTLNNYFDMLYSSYTPTDMCEFALPEYVDPQILSLHPGL
ncbi:high mobility group box domain-containing protein [Chlamydoabsidia padenii]|nr:high mobility group box domain-containing protein [Chlamydoabsidia padenii]